MIIAECGINHNGDMSLALKLIDAAVKAGADAVKFQLYEAQLLAPPGEKREMLLQCQLSPVQMRTLASYCVQYDIAFLCTPFDKGSADALQHIVPRFKIGSGQANDADFVAYVAAFGKPLIISTGMSDFADIRHTLAAVKFDVPVTLLHCVSLYPTPADKADLRRMLWMMRDFACPIGYSDHTEGIDIALAAVALGAVVIEKHLTLDKAMPGPDHRASITPDEFAALVSGARRIERACSA